MHFKKNDFWVYIFLGVRVNELPGREAILPSRSLVEEKSVIKSLIYISKYSFPCIFWNAIHFDEKFIQRLWVPSFYTDFLNYGLCGFSSAWELWDIWSEWWQLSLSSNYSKKCLRNFLQYSDELRKEPQLNCQLFVALWVSNDADVSHVSKWITVKTADLTNLK